MKIKFYFTDPLQGTTVNINYIGQFRLVNFLTKKIKGYVPPQRVGILHRFGLKTDYRLLILVWNRVWFFKRTTPVYERIYCFNSQRLRKKEKYTNPKWILRNLFVAALI